MPFIIFHGTPIPSSDKLDKYLNKLLPAKPFQDKYLNKLLPAEPFQDKYLNKLLPAEKTQKIIHKVLKNAENNL